MKPLSFVLTAFFLCLGSPFSSAQDEWNLSLGARVWYAGWALDESVQRTQLAPPNSGGGQGQNGPEPTENFTNEADPSPFYSVYLDALNGPWRVTLAYGFSGDYDFRNQRSNDTLQREDMQVMLQYSFANNVSLGAGIHRISNEGTTDGRRDGRGAQSYSYDFTGPEFTLGYAYPFYQRDQLVVAATTSATMGWYLIDDTAGFTTALEDTPGYAFDLGFAAIWDSWQAKLGYRWLYVDDTIWSIDNIEPADGGALERTVVDASETYQGAYLELSWNF